MIELLGWLGTHPFPGRCLSECAQYGLGCEGVGGREQWGLFPGRML